MINIDIIIIIVNVRVTVVIITIVNPLQLLVVNVGVTILCHQQCLSGPLATIVMTVCSAVLQLLLAQS